MFGFLFRSATYYVIWKKFQNQIVLVLFSLVLIVLISSIYDDLFEVLKVSNKDALLVLLFGKWVVISLIIGFNIYKLKQVKLNEGEQKELLDQIEEPKKVYPKKSQDVLEKKESLTTTTDLILKKYIK